LENIINNLPQQIALLDEHGVIQFVNESWRAFGRANGRPVPCVSEEPNYLAVCEVVTGADEATARAFAEAIRHALQGSTREFTLTYPCHSPWQERWFLGRVVAVTRAGRPHVLITHEDITARYALERQAQIQRVITENLAEGVCLVRASDQTILFANPRFEKMFGYEPGELNGQPVVLLNAGTPNQSGFDVAQGISETLERTGEAAYEILNLRKDCTTFWCAARTTAVDLSDLGRVWITVYEDITERRRTEQRLEESEKHVATGRMAARIAHEINNPLASIQYAFLLIKDAVPTDHPHYDFVPRIEREIGRIAQIVRGMFDLYRPEVETPHEFSVTELLGDVTQLLEQRWRKRDLKINLVTPPDDLRLHQLENALSQVLFNLIENAVDVTPDNGAIIVTASGSPATVQIHVQDCGPGIPATVAAHLFEPFATTKNSADGHIGLGLSVSLSLVRQMGGQLTYETKPGAGTTFIVTLPPIPTR